MNINQTFNIADVLNSVDTKRFTETTSAILCSDCIDDKKVVCVDLCYDADNKLPACDVVNLIELPFSDEAIHAGHILLEQLAEVYHIPVHSEIPDKKKLPNPSLSEQIQSASNRASESQPTAKMPVKETSFKH